MKDIVTYINEVSRELAKNAYNKATGAQKNRLKKLYKEIYGDDVTKSDISHIKFSFSGDAKYQELFTYDDIKDAFALWDQETLNKIHNISFYYEYDRSGRATFMKTGRMEIAIDKKSYSLEWDRDENRSYKILSSSLENKDPDTMDIYTYIAELYKEKYK